MEGRVVILVTEHHGKPRAALWFQKTEDNHCLISARYSGETQLVLKGRSEISVTINLK